MMSHHVAPLRVAVLCSHRAPGLVQLLNTDPRRGPDYELVACLTSTETFGEEVKVERRGVPCLSHPVRAWCRRRGVGLRDLDARADYDAETARMLAPYRPDLVLLDGYLLLLTAPMLEAYPNRIVNVHHSDLLLREASGGPRYPGLRAVRDAVLAGEPHTRATAHLVTDALDAGPVLLRSWPFPVPPVARWARAHDAADVLKSAVWAHQEWMLRAAWAPMLTGAIELAALALQAAGRPLDVGLAGRWSLSESAALLPDGIEVSNACAGA